MVSDPTFELSRRQREILFHVVREYVATGQPVGSKHLVQHARLPVSPVAALDDKTIAEVNVRGGIRAIQLTDIASGKSVLLGTVKDSVAGELIPRC